ncbi:ATP-binding protein [Candidatus Auribacterota bacterium]
MYLKGYGMRKQYYKRMIIFLIAAVFLSQQVVFANQQTNALAPRTMLKTRPETSSKKREVKIKNEVALVDMVAYLVNPNNEDLSELKAAINGKQTIQSILNQRPGNRDFQNGILADFIHSIFSHTHRPLVEIITNAVDALTGDPNKQKVDISIDQKGFVVMDKGKGMSLGEVLTQLLIPMISGQDGKLGKHGRFGVGFFSMLSYLKKPSDRVVVQTRAANSQGYQISFRLKKGKLMVAVTPKDGLEQGARVQLKTRDFAVEKAKQLVSHVFRTKAGVSLEVNHQKINRPENYITIFRDPKTQVAIRLSKKSITGQGIIAAAVTGATFFEVEIEGAGIPEEVIVDFSPATPFPVARDTFEVNQATRDTIKALIAGLSKRKDNLEILSLIYPLIERINKNNPKRNQDEENLTKILADTARGLERQSDHLLVPIDPQIKSISVAGKKLRPAREEFFTAEDREKFKPYLLPGFEGSGTVILAKFTGANKNKKTICSKSKKYAFINQDHYDATPLNLAHLDLLLNKQGIKGLFKDAAKDKAVVSDAIPSTGTKAASLSEKVQSSPTASLALPSIIKPEDMPADAEQAYEILEKYSDFDADFYFGFAHGDSSYFIPRGIFIEACHIFGVELIFTIMQGLLNEGTFSAIISFRGDLEVFPDIRDRFTCVVNHHREHGQSDTLRRFGLILKEIVAYKSKYPDISWHEWFECFIKGTFIANRPLEIYYEEYVLSYLQKFPQDIRRRESASDHAALFNHGRKPNGEYFSFGEITETENALNLLYGFYGRPLAFEHNMKDRVLHIEKCRELILTALNYAAKTMDIPDPFKYIEMGSYLFGNNYEEFLDTFEGREEWLLAKFAMTSRGLLSEGTSKKLYETWGNKWEERYHYLVREHFSHLDTDESKELIWDFFNYFSSYGDMPSYKIRPCLYFLQHGQLLVIKPGESLFDRIDNGQYQVIRQVDDVPITSLIAGTMGRPGKAEDNEQLWEHVEAASESTPTGYALRYAQRSLSHSVHFYAGEPRVYLRELIQNVLDELSSRKITDPQRRRLDINVFKGEKTDMLTVNFRDHLGIAFRDLVQTLLIPGVSTKRLAKELRGRFGQGFFTIFQSAKEFTIKTSTGDGKSYFIHLEPIWDKDDQIVDIDMDLREINEKTTPGTEIELTLGIPDEHIDFEAALIAYALREHVAVIDEEELLITFAGKKVNAEKRLLAEQKTPLGNIRMYQVPGFYNVTVGRLKLKDIDREYQTLIPPIVNDILVSQGIVIDLDSGFKTVRDRNDLENKDGVLPVIQGAIQAMSLQAVIRFFIDNPGIDLGLLPYDYLNNFAHYPVGSRITDDARRLIQGKAIDHEFYLNDSTRIGMLLVSLPIIEIKSKKYSLHDVMRVLNDPDSREFTFHDLPLFLQARIEEEEGSREIMRTLGAAMISGPTYKGTKKKPGRRKVLTELLDRQIPPDAGPKYAAYTAYIDFMERVVSSAYALAWQEPKDISFSFYRKGDMSLAHALQGGRHIGRNLALFSGEAELWKRLLDGDISPYEEYLLFKTAFSTNYHEACHLAETARKRFGVKAGEWTHHLEFQRREIAMIESGLEKQAELEAYKKTILSEFRGQGNSSASLEKFGAYLAKQSLKLSPPLLRSRKGSRDSKTDGLTDVRTKSLMEEFRRREKLTGASL